MFFSRSDCALGFGDDERCEGALATPRIQTHAVHTTTLTTLNPITWPWWCLPDLPGIVRRRPPSFHTVRCGSKPLSVAYIKGQRATPHLLKEGVHKYKEIILYVHCLIVTYIVHISTHLWFTNYLRVSLFHCIFQKS